MSNFTIKHKRSERIFYAIETAIVILAGIVFFVFPVQYGLLVVCWLVQNAVFYEKGKCEICVDEYEFDGYPDMGLKKMLNFWYLFIPVMFLSAFIMALLSLNVGIAVISSYLLFTLIYYVNG